MKSIQPDLHDIMTLSAALLLLLSAGSMSAATKYWDTSTDANLTGGNGIWDTGTTASWSTSTGGSDPLVTWEDGDDAVFQATVAPLSYTNTLSGTINAQSITKTTGNNRVVLTGGTLHLGEGGLRNDETSEAKALVVESPVVLTTSQTWWAKWNSPSILRVTGGISETGGSATLTLDKVAGGSGGQFELLGSNTHSGGTVLNGVGTVVVIDGGDAFGTGALTFNGGLMANIGDVVITNAIVIGSNALGPNPGSLNFAGGHVTFSGNITGSGVFSTRSVPNLKNLYLSGDNSGFTGTITNRAGTVYFNAASAGSESAVWALEGGGTRLNFGGGTLLLGTLASASLWATLSGSDDLVDYIVEVGARNEDSVFNSQISGKKLALTKVGTGKLSLPFVNGTAYNLYWGATTIRGGIISVPKLADDWTACSLGSTGATVLDGGTLEYTGAGDSCNRSITLGLNGGALAASGTGCLILSNNKAMTMPSGGTRTLTLDGSNADTNTLVAILKDDAANPTSLRKTGTGTWVLTAVNTYTGATTVNGGRLFVDGSLAAGSAVGVTAQGVLGGIGTVNGTVTASNGGCVTGGKNGAGTTTLKQLVIGDGGTIGIQTGAEGACGQIRIPSDGALILQDFAVAVEFLDGYALEGPGVKFGLVQNETAGAIDTAALDFQEGALVYDGGDLGLRVTYTGNIDESGVTGRGTGNDIVLYSAIPKAGTLMVVK